MNKRLTPFLMVQAFLVLLILMASVLWPGPWNGLRWAGIIIEFPAAMLFLIARYQIGQSFSVTAQARELVTDGLYSKVRNPIYLFGGLMILGLSLVIQKPILYVLVVIMVPVQIVRAGKEARVLEEKFGDQYRQYRRKTWF